jgi:hypothetical protein
MIQRFDTKHLKIMQSWLLKRGIELPCDEIPPFGVVAYDGETPIAMGFLRRAEGSYGIFDGLVSNPDAPGALRHQALDEVIAAVNDEADRLGIQTLIAWTRDENTRVRSAKHGYAQQDLALIARRR